jgi:hypothetical protein
VGDEHLDAVPVDIGEGELGAAMGIFTAGDHPTPRRPPGQVDAIGDLDYLGVLAQLGAVSGDRSLPGSFGHVDEHFGDIDAQSVTDHETHLPLPAAPDEPVRPSRRVDPAMISTVAGSSGNSAMASSSTVTWSAAVPDPAFPGRNIPASFTWPLSPVPARAGALSRHPELTASIRARG